ncbi:MAG: hypothetical protein ACLGSA_10390 [Acidobacteriota bacterium]
MKLRIGVQEEDASRTFSGDLATAVIGGASGNLFFIGLPGVGRRDLALASAGALGLSYVDADSPHALKAALASSGQAVAVTGVALNDALIKALRSSGKVFYIMTAAPILAKRLGDVSRLEELAAEVERLEPVFMRAAHFIMPLAATPQEMLEDVREKALL